MKKFTKIMVCLLLCVMSVLFVACGDDRSDKEKDFTYSISGDVYGNSGLAVQKGNYVYFVNVFLIKQNSKTKSENNK